MLDITPVQIAKQPLITNIASDGLRVGLSMPLFFKAREFAKEHGGWWSFGRRMWVFSNASFKKALSAIDGILTSYPTYEADKVRDFAVAAYRDANPEFFVDSLDAQLMPLQQGGFACQFKYDGLAIAAMKHLRAIWHKAANTWEIKAPLASIYEALATTAGLVHDHIYLHDQTLTLEELSAPSGNEVGLSIDIAGIEPSIKLGTDATESGNRYLSSCPPPRQQVVVDEAYFRRIVDMAKLYDYQEAGVRHLVSTTGALLADDMGLGKSRQSVVAAKIAAREEPILVTCPASLRINWQREINAVFPGDQVAAIGESDPQALEAAQWHITTYERLGGIVTKAIPYRVVLVDEAQYLKEVTANRTKNAFILAIKIPFKFLLSGTPVLSRESEIYTLLRLTGHELGLMPFKEFCKEYTGDKVARGRLRLAIKDWLLRRSKNVLKHLPPKVYDVVHYQPDEGLSQYHQIMADSTPTFVKITKLRQYLEQLKFTYIINFIRQLQPGDKILIFCEYLNTVNALKTELEASNIGAVSITGEDSVKKRQKSVDALQNDEGIQVFIGTTMAAGVGITLTSANYVLFAGLPWTPALKRQAEDRSYRNGQLRTVFVNIPIIPGTIDEDLYQLLESKSQIEKDVLEGGVTEQEMMNAVSKLIRQQRA